MAELRPRRGSSFSEKLRFLRRQVREFDTLTLKMSLCCPRMRTMHFANLHQHIPTPDAVT